MLRTIGPRSPADRRSRSCGRSSLRGSGWLIAIIVALVGVALNVARLAAFDLSDPAVLLDFAAYYNAAERMLHGASPYAALQLDGSTAAYCRDCFLYPPVFAQLLAPVALVSLESCKVVWIVIAYTAAFVSTWLATGIGGAARTAERAVWCLAAVMLFDVVGSAVWVGNVGTLVGLSVTMVALGGATAGVGAAFGALLKIAPATLVPAAFVADRQSRIALASTFALVVAVSFVLAPQAWFDYPSILREVFADPSGSDVNLALTHSLATWGLGVHRRGHRPGGVSGRGRGLRRRQHLARTAAWRHAGGRSAGDRRHAHHPRHAVVPLSRGALAVRGHGLPRAGAGARGLLLIAAALGGYQSLPR